MPGLLQNFAPGEVVIEVPEGAMLQGNSDLQLYLELRAFSPLTRRLACCVNAAIQRLHGSPTSRWFACSQIRVLGQHVFIGMYHSF